MVRRMRIFVPLAFPLLFACGRWEDPLSGVGGGSIHDSRRGNLTAKVFSTDQKKLYYAIIIANQDFEPLNPPVTFAYTYSTERGGTLTVNGQPILPSPIPRLLALNPFGQMEEIPLSPAEAAIVLKGEPEPIWEQVALPRLALIDGKTVDGVRVGHWKVSGTSGAKGYEGDYVDGKRDGEWKYYDADGKPRATVTYLKGRLHGPMVETDRNGQEARRVEWKDNFPVGTSQTWQCLGYTMTRTPEGGESVSSR
ncbi:MAG TPA: hypothetical protein VKU80_02935 [Planctomycetota bacterium]|nr:hypothetical protein [Planctomycetota bacterium]